MSFVASKKISELDTVGTPAQADYFPIVSSVDGQTRKMLISQLLSFIDIPTGTIMPYGGTTAPASYALCDGSVLNQADEPALYAVIGSNFNTGGESAGTFRLPDLRGRAPVGAGTGSGLTARSLGVKVGTETHTLTTSEMPSHTHTQNAHTHTQDAHTHTQNSHTHTQASHNHTTLGYLAAGPGAGSSFTYLVADMVTSPQVANGASATPVINSSTATNQSTTATNQSTTATNQNTGGDTAHNNMQPSLVLNFIIKK